MTNFFQIFFYYLKDDLYRRTIVLQKWISPKRAATLLIAGMFVESGIFFWILRQWSEIFTNNSLVAEVTILLFYLVALGPSFLNIRKFLKRYHYYFFKIRSNRFIYIQQITLINYFIIIFYSLPFLIVLMIIGKNNFNILIYVIGILVGYLIYVSRILMQQTVFAKWVMLLSEYGVAYVFAMVISKLLFNSLLFFQHNYVEYGFSKKLNTKINNSIVFNFNKNLHSISNLKLGDYINSHKTFLVVIFLALVFIIIYLMSRVKEVSTKKEAKDFTTSRNLSFNRILVHFNYVNFWQDLDVQKYPKLIQIIPVEYFLILGVINAIIPRLTTAWSVLVIGTYMIAMMTTCFYKNIIGLSTNVFDYAEDYNILPLIKTNPFYTVNELTKAKYLLLENLSKPYLLIAMVTLLVVINYFSECKGLFLIFPALIFFTFRKYIILGSLRTNHEVFKMLSKVQYKIEFETLSDVVGFSLIRQKNRIALSISNNFLAFIVIAGFSFKIITGFEWATVSIAIIFTILCNFWINSKYLI